MTGDDIEGVPVACSTADVTEESPAVVEVDGTNIAIFLVHGEYHAIQNTCPHQGGPLADGKIEEDCVYCPWHGWEFDLESGEHAQNAATADTYDVHVSGEDIYVV